MVIGKRSQKISNMVYCIMESCSMRWQVVEWKFNLVHILFNNFLIAFVIASLKEVAQIANSIHFVLIFYSYFNLFH